MNKPYTGRDWAIGALILLVAVALRARCLACEPLWLDESYSWWDARQSFADLWRVVPLCDPHPPLYAALLHGWITLFGDSAVALRAFSTFNGVLATAFVMLAGRQIDPRIGWIAGLLYAVAPFQVEYGLEARPYTLVSLGAAMLLYGLLRVLRDEPRFHAGWLALVLGGAISLWSNNTAVFTLAAAGAAVILALWREREKSRLLKPFVAAAAVVMLLWLPYLPVYLEQARGVSDDFWIPPPNVWRVANELRFVVGLGDFYSLWPLLIGFVLGLVALWRRGGQRYALVVAAMFALPLAFNFIVSLLVKPIFLARALMGIAPAFTVGLAAALSAVPRRAPRMLAVGIVVAACLWVVNSSLYRPDRKEPWDRIAEAVAQQGQGDALLIAVPNELVLPLEHALRGNTDRIAVRGAPADFPAPGMQARYPSGKCAPAVNGQALDALAAAAIGRPRVLLLTRRNNVYDPLEDLPALLTGLGFRETATQEYLPGHLQLRRYEMPYASGGAP